MSEFFNTGLSQQQFLDEYWQKKPLLIRNAFAIPVTDLAPDDLAGFACEQDIESRLIEQTDKQQWSLTNGPLEETVFSRLPEKDWTLLVQDMDKHWPDLQNLLTPFRFIPDWRRDDIMVSYAVPGGSVGAHLDNYDVFLLQAQGVRRWQIALQPDNDPAWLDNCDLRILQAFDAEQSWDLQPGDMLYLPPKFAHHGIAQSDCMTISIGFRAPTQRQLLDAFVDVLADSEIADCFYADTDLQTTQRSAEIDDAVLVRVKTLLTDALDQHPDLVLKAFGRQVTENKASLESWMIPDADDLETVDDLNAFFEQGGSLSRNDFMRFAWHQSASSVMVFVGGQDFLLPADCVDWVARFCSANQFKAADWEQIQNQAALSDLLLALLAEGAWLPD